MMGLSVALVDEQGFVIGLEAPSNQFVGPIIRGNGASYKLQRSESELIVSSVDHHMGER